MIRSPYEVLNIEAHADSKTIRRAYKEMIRTYGPEHHPDEFSEIRKAFEYLSKEQFFEAAQDFPIYTEFLNDFDRQVLELQSKDLSKEEILTLLSVVFETPYNTAFELKSLLDND